MTRIHPLAACALATLLLAGCGSTTGGGDAEETTPSPAETVAEETPETEATTPERSESPTPTSNLVEMNVGDTAVTDRGSEITVHEVRLDIPFDYESEDGGAWHAIDVEYCMGDDLPDLEVFQQFAYAWVLRTEEGYVLDYPGSSYDGIVSPQLDLYSVTPVAGECYRGWVLIDGPSGTTVTSARVDELDWRLKDS